MENKRFFYHGIGLYTIREIMAKLYDHDTLKSRNLPIYVLSVVFYKYFLTSGYFVATITHKGIFKHILIPIPSPLGSHFIIPQTVRTRDVIIHNVCYFTDEKYLDFFTMDDKKILPKLPIPTQKENINSTEVGRKIYNLSDIIFKNYNLLELKSQIISREEFENNIRKYSRGSWLLTVSRPDFEGVENIRAIYGSVNDFLMEENNYNWCSIHNMVHLNWDSLPYTGADMLPIVKSTVTFDFIRSVIFKTSKLSENKDLISILENMIDKIGSFMYHYGIASHRKVKDVLENKINNLIDILGDKAHNSLLSSDYKDFFDMFNERTTNILNSSGGAEEIKYNTNNQEIKISNSLIPYNTNKFNNLPYSKRYHSTSTITKDISFSLAKIENGVHGSFIIKLSGINTENGKALFLFIDHSFHQITRYKLFAGKSHYRAFADFIINTLLEKCDTSPFEIENIKAVFIPRNYINDKLTNSIKISTGYSIIPYGLKSENLPKLLVDVRKAISVKLLEDNIEQNINNFNFILKHSNIYDKYNTLGFTVKKIKPNHVHKICDSNTSSKKPKSISKNLLTYKLQSFKTPTIKDHIKIKSYLGQESSFHTAQINFISKMDYGPKPGVNQNLPKDLQILKSGSKWFILKKQIGDIPISEIIIEQFVREFWKYGFDSYPSDNKNFAAMLMVQFTTGLIRSISYLQNFTKDSLEKAIEVYKLSWDLKDETYHHGEVESLLIQYRFLNANVEIEKSIKPLNQSKEISKFSMHSGINMPITMNLKLWGDIINSNRKGDTLKIRKFNSHNIVYEISIVENINIVTVFSNGRKIISLRDTQSETDKDPSSFTRVIGNRTYHYEKSELRLFTEDKKVEKISKLSTHVKDKTNSTSKGGKRNFSTMSCNTPTSHAVKKIYNKLKSQKSDLNKNGVGIGKKGKLDNFISMDIETRVDKNGVMVPICISWYDGVRAKTLYISDFNSPAEMIMKAFKNIMINKYSNHIVYIHNFSKFDALFILKPLSMMNLILKTIFRDGNIIKLDILSTNKKCKITIYDSYLMIPISLEKAAKGFNVEHKRIFPYLFPDIKPLDYEGKVPSFKYFSNISKEQYYDYIKQYEENTWNLKVELIKYCEQDVISLHQTMKAFTNHIFNLFKIKTLKYPTLPSLAFAIFRTHFMEHENIPIITGEIYDFLKKGYTGGFVEVYKPFSKQCYSYDVNSLYPDSMSKYDMPVGEPKYFEGDIRKYVDKPFGFFEAIVEAPSDLHVPLLPFKIKTRKGYRTLTSLGSWESVYFSEELYNAEKHGYKIKIIRGYLFERSNIFKKYVETLYSLKKKSKNINPPLYLIAKLLLNTLYGRFGLNPDFETTEILSNEDSEKIIADPDKLISKVVDFGTGKTLISYKQCKNEKDYLKNDEHLNVSVSISAAIAAWSRISMTEFLTKYSDILLYIDTDGIKTSAPIHPNYIGDNLGQMEFEGKYKESVFIAPKNYALMKDGHKCETDSNDLHKISIVKIKGVKKNNLGQCPISFQQVKEMLNNTKIELTQKIWRKNMEGGSIRQTDSMYKLMLNDNKRKIIFDKDGKFVDTKPYIIKDGKIVNDPNN